MRKALVEALIELARTDERIFLVTADLGWSVVEEFARAFPDRFLNVGVAEANMLGVATGLAQVGYVPFAYSIATFASMRCYEQLRNGPILHGLPVRLIGIGGGFAYGHAGPTHYALEDLSITRAQPGLTVLAPADPGQTQSALRATIQARGPVYLRIGKGNNPEVPGLGGRFAFERPELVRDGADVLLLACGSITSEAMKAAELLASEGINAALAVVAHLSFRGTPALSDLLGRFRCAVTVEEGFRTGGLGSLVAETIAENGLSCRLTMQAVTQSPSGVSGSEEYLRAQHGLDAAGIARAVRSVVAAAG